MSKILTVNCPCCGKVLEIDSLSGEVLSSRDKKKFASLEDFMEKEKQRPKELESMFEAANDMKNNIKKILDNKVEISIKSMDTPTESNIEE